MPGGVRTSELLHVKQCAALLDVHEATIRRAIHSGALDALRVGPHGRYRVRRDALERFLRPVAPSAADHP